MNTALPRGFRSDVVARVAPLALAAALPACSAGGGSVPGASGGAAATGGFVGVGGTAGANTSGQGGVPGGAGGDTSTGALPGSGGVPASGGTASTGGGTGVVGSGGEYAYDPTVAFDWPEAVATAGSCKAGKYSGTFDGLYLSPAAFGAPVPIAGNVDLVLQESQDGEFFKLADGKISGFVFGTIPFSSGLTGSLNCTTAKLEDGFMPNGTYNAFGTDYFYEGPLDADYDKLSNAFVNGKWTVGEPTYQRGAPRTQFGGEGTWTVKYVGP